MAAIVIRDCHPDQRHAVIDPGRRVSLLVGRGGGKTSAMRARLVIKALRIPRAKLCYVALTRVQATDLMWYPLKDLLERLGVEATFNETHLRCTIKRTGSMIRLVGADDKREIDKLRGQSFHEVAIDEAGSHPSKLLETLLFRVIGPRLGDKEGSICLGGTPGHNLDGEFYEATRPGGEKHQPWGKQDKNWQGWTSHFWTLETAARKVPAMARLWAAALIEKAQNKWSDDHPIWLREYLGIWAADDTENVFKFRPHLADGREWNIWDPPRGEMGIAKLPDTFKDWAFVFAMDEGSKDPFACNAFAFSPSDTERCVYHVFCFEKLKMYAQPIARLLLGDELSHSKPGGLIGHLGWPDGMIGDFGNSLIEELQNVYGLRVLQSDRSTKYKFAAIEVVNGDLIDGRLKILKDSPLAMQMMQLQWKKDDFGIAHEDKAQPNHSTDCLILGRIVIGRLITAGAVAPPSRSTAYIDPQGLDHGGNSENEFEGLTTGGNFDEMWGG